MEFDLLIDTLLSPFEKEFLESPLSDEEYGKLSKKELIQLCKNLNIVNVSNLNNSYGAISDVKLKENIIDATPKLEDLCKVKIRQYNLKSDPDHKQIGVVAQELEEVFAGLVETTIDKDLKGNDLGTTTKQVKYSVFVPMLIKAMQEQQTLINNLTTRLNALEGK
jgi:hypothetical protein